MKTKLDFPNSSIISNFLSKKRYRVAFEIFQNSGTKMQTKKRRTQMYLFGGTIGWSRTPMFKICNSEKRHMLPRPVVACRPGNYGYLLTHSDNWLKKLTIIIQDLTIDFLKKDSSEKSKEVLVLTKKCKEIVPSCLRICDSFFTAMIVVGDFSGEGEIPLHKDNDDHINAIVSIGDNNIDGGKTIYYSGLKMEDVGEKQRAVHFHHGRVQIGYFDDIIHGAEKWTNGNRCIINFCMKKKILNHFLKFGNKYYEQFVKAGYPHGLLYQKFLMTILQFDDQGLLSFLS